MSRSNDDNNENKALNRLYDQLDRIESRLDTVDITLTKNTVILDEHIRRTELLENALKPIDSHVKNMQAAGKIFMWVGGGATTAVAVIEVVKAFLN